MNEYGALLKQAGFKLTASGSRTYWRLDLKDSKVNQRAMFTAVYEGEEREKAEAFLLLCKEDFSQCVMFYDGDVFNIKTEDFMEYIRRYIVAVQGSLSS